MSVKFSRTAAEETYMYNICTHWDDQGSCLTSYQELFTVNYLQRNHSTLKEGEEISKILSDKIMYIGVMTGCKEVTDINEKQFKRKPCKVAHSCQSSQSLSNEKKTEIFSDQNLERLLRSLLFTTIELCSV